MAACGQGSQDVGSPCKDSSQCGFGETCLVFSGTSSQGCDASVQACSKACVEDADCNALAAGLTCFQGCGDNPNFCAKSPK
ncbi:MAG: hypothetical protein JST54_20860 [Deltaproteobacteria bacterium]|nr:hypothetical protein [Deltaproteobacteria bacterium]